MIQEEEVRGEFLIGIVTAIPAALLALVLWSSFPGHLEGAALLGTSILLMTIMVAAALLPIKARMYKSFATILAIGALAVVASSPSLYGLAQAMVLSCSAMAVWNAPTNRVRAYHAIATSTVPAIIIVMLLVFSGGL